MTPPAALPIVVVGLVVAGLALLGATSATPDDDGAWAAPDRLSAGYVAPVRDGTHVVRRFEPPTVRWGPGHRGVDLAARVGAPVHAPAGGVVTFVGPVVDRSVITITHADGLRSSLEPVVTEVDGLAVVTTGAVVVAGQVVGSVQDVPGHCRPATCVHWGVRRGEEYIDPLRLLLAGPTVLLPDLPG